MSELASVSITDERVCVLCQNTRHLLPYALLKVFFHLTPCIPRTLQQDCLQQNVHFTTGDTRPQAECKKLNESAVEVVLSVGRHKTTVLSLQ